MWVGGELDVWFIARGVVIFVTKSVDDAGDDTTGKYISNSAYDLPIQPIVGILCISPRVSLSLPYLTTQSTRDGTAESTESRDAIYSV